MDLTERRAPIWPFLAVASFFGVQHLVGREVGEPYPAIRQPPFAGVVVDSLGRYTLRSVEVELEFEDGGSASLSGNDLLAMVPEGHRDIILRLHFRPSAAWRSPPAAFVPPNFGDSGPVERFAKRLLPGYVVAFHRSCCVDGVPDETVRWLERRLEEIYPDRRASRATFTWSVETIDPGGGSRLRTREPAGQLVIDFRSGSA